MLLRRFSDNVAAALKHSYWFVLGFAATWVLTSTLNWTFDIGMTVARLQGVKA